MTRDKVQTFQMRVSPEWLAVIDDWRRSAPEIPSRAEAIRRLAVVGIQSHPILNEMLDFFERHGDPADAETQGHIRRLKGIISE